MMVIDTDAKIRELFAKYGYPLPISDDDCIGKQIEKVLTKKRIYLVFSDHTMLVIESDMDSYDPILDTPSIIIGVDAEMLEDLSGHFKDDAYKEYQIWREALEAKAMARQEQLLYKKLKAKYEPSQI